MRSWCSCCCWEMSCMWSRTPCWWILRTSPGESPFPITSVHFALFLPDISVKSSIFTANVVMLRWAYSHVRLAFVVTGMLTAIRGTRQRKPRLNKTPRLHVWPSAHHLQLPLKWTVAVRTETLSVLTVPGEINTLYAVILTHTQAHS